ncbi:MAG: helix-turn-helix transcriptional regulator, partial [Clostridiales bacterium]|nr:helix-turn-helix transcriptional regulator [Clostridiales bacterium]
GWSQEMLSAFAGIGRSHLSMIETGRKEPSVETLCRIADALGYRLSELIRKVEDACDEQNN